MTIAQLCLTAPQLAEIERNHGNLPSLRRFSAGDYADRLALDGLLATLEAEIRLLAAGHEPGAGNGATYSARVTAAKRIAAILDGVNA